MENYKFKIKDYVTVKGFKKGDDKGEIQEKRYFCGEPRYSVYMIATEKTEIATEDMLS